MNKLVKLAIGCVFGMAGISAQAQQDLPVLPTEMFACNYVDGSDMTDLNRSFAQFNTWADRAGIDDLTMFLLTPNFFSDDVDYDLIGLNIWPDGAAFASGNAKISDDPDAYGSFDGVVECSSHALYALVGVKPPTQDVESGGLFEFTNCTMKGNRSNNEGIAAIAGVAQLFERYNINDAHAAFFNLAGLAPDTSYQFKWVTYYPSFEAWGRLFDGIVGDGAVQDIDAIVNPVMQCDSSRIYNTTVERMAAGE